MPSFSPCITCHLELKPGSSHATLEDCVAALLHELEQARMCHECKRPVPLVAHPGCVPKVVAKRATDAGLDAAQARVIDGFARWMTGERPPAEDDEPGPQRRERPARDKRERFEP